MMANRRANRLFIVADSIVAGEATTAWVEIRLTDQFLDRVLELHTLLTQHHLEEVTAAVEANWQLESKWTVYGQYSNSGCLMRVFDSGFSVECMAIADGDCGQKEHCSILQASYIWGYISELVEDMRPSTVFPQSYFEKLGLFESDDEHDAFRNMVINGP